MKHAIKHIHFVGIGGSGMCGIAEVLHNLGYKVSGSDLADSATLARLRTLGVATHVGHAAAHIAGADAVVTSTAVQQDNPEVLAARERKIPIVPRAVMLAELMRLRRGIAIAGTHGKTTTTSMLAWILEYAGLAPGFLIGGIPENFGLSARLPGAPRQEPSGKSPFFVIEADEYDTAFFDKRSKFVHYHPRTAILNNLEFDHADIFPDLQAIETQFHHLVRTVPASGRLVVNARDEALQRVLARGQWSEVQRFGAKREEPGVLRVRGEPQAFDVLRGALKVGRVEWALMGEHNQLNALAAIAAAEHVGVAPEQACAALASFQNVRRRMELRGEAGGVKVYDDFAHHPTAIRTTVDGLRRRIAPGDRVLAIFEPRSNTMKLGAMKAQLPWALEEADLSFCHQGGLGWDAREALAPLGAHAQVADDVDALVASVVKLAKPGDHLLCMSNGGFSGIHDKLLRALASRA